MTYSFADCIQARNKRMESGCASTILAASARSTKREQVEKMIRHFRISRSYYEPFRNCPGRSLAW